MMHEIQVYFCSRASVMMKGIGVVVLVNCYNGDIMVPVIVVG